jgi:hypothetical protein
MHPSPRLATGLGIRRPYSEPLNIALSHELLNYTLELILNELPLRHESKASMGSSSK